MQGAVSKLMITDSLFRSVDLRTRKEHVQLVENVTAGGGKVTVFSSMHFSGEQLEKVSGVAALLRFPIPPIEGEGSDSDDTSEMTDDGNCVGATYDMPVSLVRGAAAAAAAEAAEAAAAAAEAEGGGGGEAKEGKEGKAGGGGGGKAVDDDRPFTGADSDWAAMGLE